VEVEVEETRRGGLFGILGSSDLVVAGCCFAGAGGRFLR
jgi:hypothetical protein